MVSMVIDKFDRFVGEDHNLKYLLIFGVRPGFFLNKSATPLVVYFILIFPNSLNFFTSSSQHAYSHCTAGLFVNRWLQSGIALFICFKQE